MYFLEDLVLSKVSCWKTFVLRLYMIFISFKSFKIGSSEDTAKYTHGMLDIILYYLQT